MKLPAATFPFVALAAILAMSACGGGQGNSSVAEVGGAPQSASHAVQLSWNASPNAQGYNIYREPQFGSTTKLNSAPEVATVFKDTDVQAGQTYHYYVTAVGGNSVQSSPSNEVLVTVPGP